MQKNQHHAAAQIAVVKLFLRKHRKQIIITLSVIMLNFIFGFDPKFTLINLIWLLF